MDEREASIAGAFHAAEAGDLQSAIAGFRAILERTPGDPLVAASLGQIYLLKGDFARGLPMWERRAQQTMPFRRWRGEPLKGSMILLAGEQGFGDNVQFVRFAELVARRGGRVAVACREGLGALLATAPGVDAVVEPGGAIPDGVSLWAPMMSLPLLCNVRPSTLPAHVPYLRADPKRVQSWRDRLAGVTGLKVGLVWSGNRAAPYDYRRSPGLQSYATMLDLPGVAFFSLQKGEGQQDLIGRPLPPSFIDLGPELKDFDDTAAAMMNLDLVISSCTAPAHLAGALGRPVWVILGRFPYWCWQLGSSASPWYPTATLFRQEVPNDWTCVLAKVKTALGDLVRSHAAVPTMAG